MDEVRVLFAILTAGIVSPAHADSLAGYPKTGFEFEFPGYAVARFDPGRDSAGRITRESPFSDIEEKSGDAYQLAETNGPVPEDTKWPLFRITADNVRSVDAPGVALFFHPDLARADDRAFVYSDAQRITGTLEIVTGPLVYSAESRRDVLRAVGTFMEMQYQACRRNSYGAEHFLPLAQVIRRYNDAVAIMIFATPNIAVLLTLSITGPADSYINCPPDTSSDSFRNSSPRIQEQLTLGAPFEYLNNALDSGAGSGWNRVPLADLAKALDSLTSLTVTDKEELKGLVRVWQALTYCAVNPDPAYYKPAAGEKLLVYCRKTLFDPLPHADLCAVADAYWEQLGDRRPGKLDELARSLSSWASATIDSASATWRRIHASDEKQKSDAVAAFVNSLLMPATCKQYWQDRDDRYMGFADATIVPPLELRVSRGVRLLGLALELRQSLPRTLFADSDIESVDLAKPYFAKRPTDTFDDPGCRVLRSSAAGARYYWMCPET